MSPVAQTEVYVYQRNSSCEIGFAIKFYTSDNAYENQLRQCIISKTIIVDYEGELKNISAALGVKFYGIV